MRGTQNPQNLFTKNCVFILTCLNFSHLQSTLHLMQSTYWNIFPLLKIVLNSLIFMPLSWHFFVCLFHLFHIGKTFPFEDFFHLERQKICCSGWDRMDREGRAWEPCCLWGGQPLNTQHSVGRCACKSPIMKWTNTLKESSKKFTEAEHRLSQQHQLVHGYRWLPRRLT